MGVEDSAIPLAFMIWHSYSIPEPSEKGVPSDLPDTSKHQEDQQIPNDSARTLEEPLGGHEAASDHMPTVTLNGTGSTTPTARQTGSTPRQTGSITPTTKQTGSTPCTARQTGSITPTARQPGSTPRAARQTGSNTPTARQTASTLPTATQTDSTTPASQTSSITPTARVTSPTTPTAKQTGSTQTRAASTDQAHATASEEVSTGQTSTSTSPVDGQASTIAQARTRASRSRQRASAGSSGSACSRKDMQKPASVEEELEEPRRSKSSTPPTCRSPGVSRGGKAVKRKVMTFQSIINPRGKFLADDYAGTGMHWHIWLNAHWHVVELMPSQS